MISQIDSPEPLVELDVDLVFVHEKLFELEQEIEQLKSEKKYLLLMILDLTKIFEKVLNKEVARGKEASA